MFGWIVLFGDVDFYNIVSQIIIGTIPMNSDRQYLFPSGASHFLGCLLATGMLGMTDGYYFPPKVLSYKDQIVQLYTAKHIRFEKMTVQRTIERKSAVEDLVGKLQECLKKAGDPE